MIAGVLVDQGGEKNLIKLGVKDSKLLTPRQRERLFDKIVKVVKAYQTIIVEPAEIDRAVNGHGGLNLNWLEAEKTAGIVNALKPTIVYLDCPSPNIENYRKYLRKKLDNKMIEIVAEHKADVKYPIVSAASILAKVTRDRAIQKIQKTIAEPIGSGYPSDPITCEFLKNNYKKYPDIFRKSWMSYRQCSEQKRQKRLDEF